MTESDSVPEIDIVLHSTPIEPEIRKMKFPTKIKLIGGSIIEVRDMAHYRELFTGSIHLADVDHNVPIDIGDDDEDET